jgi:hypothetical protein
VPLKIKYTVETPNNLLAEKLFLTVPRELGTLSPETLLHFTVLV